MLRFGCLMILVLVSVKAGLAGAAPLSADDFTFEGPLGSQGTTIEKVGENHFVVSLGAAPGHPDWNNRPQFTILRNAKGNSLRLDVQFDGGPAYYFNEYAFSYSYDGEHWQPVHWLNGPSVDKQHDTLVFPHFEQDVVYVGHQVPMSYEKLVELVAAWKKSPFVTVHVLGKSIEGRDLYRLEITDPKSDVPRKKRWAHFFANQHPGEHNSQWRMAGMIDWMLSGEAAGFRRRSICHFVPMMSPDAPSKGWYRVNAQGYDMNRTYLHTGADQASQALEACIVQRDLEMLMASEAPPVSAWSIHTWGGKTDPRIIAGPEMTEDKLGPWTRFGDIIEQYDVNDVIRPMEEWPLRDGHQNQWTEGTHTQFGITSILCEGGGALYTKEENVEAGEVLMRAIADYYAGTRD
ncbi:MAG TPA: M14 family zinc carboxypeptidase [Candidatus Hydrogenedentes bacterium]|nr:M14 family zinc carboxypeptidase [Candidatus Hydrogenedentota bacterium]